MRYETQRIASRKPLIAGFRKLNPAYPVRLMMRSQQYLHERPAPGLTTPTDPHLWKRMGNERLDPLRSLTPCVPIAAMRCDGLIELPTNNEHFVQEEFSCLLSD